MPPADADNLRTNNIDNFYNSITLLGEFYNRLHQKTHPILIMGVSLFEVLTKQLRREIEECKKDSTHVFDVQFARLILAQVSYVLCVMRSFNSGGDSSSFHLPLLNIGFPKYI